MARPKKKVVYDQDLLEREILKAVVELYTSAENSDRDVSFVADELDISALKARKLLITAGERTGYQYYTSPLYEKVRLLKKQGRSVREIEEAVRISHASVIGYLPYTKTVYSMRELSADAIRIQRFRERQRLCAGYMSKVADMETDAEEQYLWELLQRLAGCVFYLRESDGMVNSRFRYSVADNNLEINKKKIIIDRPSVVKKYWEVRRSGDGESLTGSEEWYLESIFERIGVCRK